VLESAKPSHLGDAYLLDRARLRFGRAEWNEIDLRHDDSVSRGVGWFERREDGGWWVVDNGSTCGVSVNDIPLPRVEGDPSRRAQVLRPGDRVRVGRTLLAFHVDASAG
jgi:hypothetical protein